MNFARLTTCLLLLLLFGGVATADAAGLGLFLSSAQGHSDWEEDHFTFEADSHQLNWGLVIDSNVASDRLFNYRFELGRSKSVIENFDHTGSDAELSGLMMAHDFGFGAQLAPSLRFWFGPELRLTYLNGDLESDNRYDVNLVGYGVGAVAGLNINLPHRLTLGVKSGFVVMRYAGDGDYYDTNLSVYRNADYRVDEELAFVTLSIMFRTDRPR